MFATTCMINVQDHASIVLVGNMTNSLITREVRNTYMYLAVSAIKELALTPGRGRKSGLVHTLYTDYKFKSLASFVTQLNTKLLCFLDNYYSSSEIRFA